MAGYFRATKRLFVTAVLSVCCFSIALPALADDTEAYLNNTKVKPNVTFIFDTSGSMNNTVTGTGKTRLEVVQEVFNNFIDGASGINVNLMRFSANRNGGYFLTPMQEVTASSRAGLKSVVSGLTHGSGTPLAEALYEAALFYRGEEVFFGHSSTPGTNHAGVFQGGVYISPIKYQCQKNFIVLLTDGQPSSDGDADSRINGLPGFSNTAGTCDFNASNDCLDELAHYLYETDQSNLAKDQTIITYTIGFQTNQQLLDDAARKGGGQYLTANDNAGLTNAFSTILTKILNTRDTLIAPPVVANTVINYHQQDEIYFTMFMPSDRPLWTGNLKRYALEGSPPVITDGNSPAVASDGTFENSATSFWTPASDAPDGNDIKKGGAASKLGPNRTLFTYIDDTNGQPQYTLLHENSTAITPTLLNIGSNPAYRKNLLQWARGIDILDEDKDKDTTEPRHHIGDPLHSKPVLVRYGGSTNKTILFTATNEGFLHAINTEDGAEQFAFMPQELLPNLTRLFDNLPGNDHPYGLDGPISVWIDEKAGGKEHVVDPGEQAILYVGMRRGGRNYYALNITDLNNPTLMWTIEGGTGDFTQLGQTWSRMIPTKIMINGSKTDVLVFGGGYDTNQDTANTTSSTDTIGNAIYIVNAKTGDLIWEAGASPNHSNHLSLSDMQYSIPSELKAIDINLDGLLDQIYVGDMGGQLWRIDFKQDTQSTGVTIKGGVIADLGGSGRSGNRRFYNAPDVVLVKKAGAPYLAINIGSGYRSHPLDTTVDDYFYSIRSKNIDSAPTTYTAITETDLFNATSNIIGEGTDAQITAARNTLNNNSAGWRIELDPGEKVLSEAITLNNNVMFTTFTPATKQAAPCTLSAGTTKFYLLNQLDATPLINLDKVGSNLSLTRSDRSTKLQQGSIDPEVLVVISDSQTTSTSGSTTTSGLDKTASPLANNESFPNIDLGRLFERTYWSQ